MKRKILFSFMLACISALVFGALNVSADTYGDLTYIIDNEKITITGCSQSATNIEIPNTIEGYPVTKIGYQAFYDCKNIKSVTIPENITYINGNAFYNCIYI